MRSHNNWLWNGRCLFEGFELRRGDAILNIRPLVNMAAIGGSFMSWLLTGGRLVLHHPLDIRLALEQIRTEGVNLAYMPPTFFMSLLADASLASRADLSSLRVLGTGSAALSAQAIERMERDYGIEIVNVFGSNEGVGMLSRRQEIPDPAYRASFFPRCGRREVEWPNLAVYMQQESRLVDPATNEEITEPGVAGELRMRSPGIFPGYIGEEELNKKAFDDQGFYCSGDLFEIAGEGALKKYYKFVGRLKDIIVRGGIKIAPAELDELISGHPLLKDAAFFGYADDRLGEKVGVAVVPKAGSPISLADVIGFMKEKHVAVYKLPERLLVLDELPRNAMLKVVRRRLTEIAGARAVEG
jgi:non-ribosomal peptide synthetase component E (peptide arylation enzyme)